MSPILDPLTLTGHLSNVGSGGMIRFTHDPLYRRHRFPAEVIAHTVWLYFRFPLRLRMVEDMLAFATGNAYPARRAGYDRKFRCKINLHFGFLADNRHPKTL